MRSTSSPRAARVPRLGRVTATLALAILLSTTACKTTAGGSGASPTGVPSNATIAWRDAGGVDLVNGAVTLALPDGELAAGEKPTVMRDDAGKRLAFPKTDGEVRYVYVLGDALYLGAKVKGPVDFGKAPELDGAFGSLFENAGERRETLVAEVTKAKGEAGVTRLLVDGAHVDDKAWDAAYAKLPAARTDEIKTALATRLEKGKPAEGLRRAVALVPIRDAAKLGALEARTRELLEPIREPRATAAMLRVVTALDKAKGAAIGCVVLDKAPLANLDHRIAPEVLDAAGREALVEAALLAVAAGASSPGGPTPCLPKIEAALGDDPCVSALRCGEKGPVDPTQTSKQDEPLCTKAEVEKVVAAELERAPADVVSLAKGTRSALFAYATLAMLDKVPAAITNAHARRRFALTQPASPECDTSMTPGTPCHCDEAMLRDQTCRHPESKSVNVALCKWEIDDKAKKITNVVFSPPP